MKTSSRWISAILAIALLVVGPAASLAQSSYYFWWQAVDEYDRPYKVLPGGRGAVNCSVFRPNTHAALVLHTTSTLGNATTSNDPLFTDINGRLHFYSSANDPVDVACYADNGGMAQINRLRTTDHKIIIPRSEGMKVSRFSVNSTAVNYQQDSGISIPQGGVIRDVIVQNLNPLQLGTYHLSIGFLGNHSVATSNSLVTALPLTSIAIGNQPAASPEWMRPGLVEGVSPGLNTGAGTHRGSALATFHADACSGPCGGIGANSQTGVIVYREKPYIVHVASGLTISYSAQPGTGAGLRVHVYVVWNSYHTGVNRLNSILGY